VLQRLAASLLPGLSLLMGTALLIEVLLFSLADDTPQPYTRIGTLCAAAPVVVGTIALLVTVLRTRIDWELNHPLLIGGMLLVIFGLAISAAAYAQFTDPQAFAHDAPESAQQRVDFAAAGAVGSWLLVVTGFLFYVLSIRPMKYKAKYEQDQRPSIIDLMDRDRTTPRSP
jgi:hypothetical protein